MKVDIPIPSPGESISEVEIAQWMVTDGEYVEKDQVIAEIDSDKATLELLATDSGAISLKAGEGETIEVGAIVASVDTSVKGTAKKKEVAAPATPAPTAPAAAPAPEKKTPVPVATDHPAKGHPSPAARKMMADNGVANGSVPGSGVGGRVTKQDVVAYLAGGFDASAAAGWGGTRNTENKKLSSLRRKIATRLVAVKNETAMLTTFNEVDMTAIMEIRKKYKVK